MSDFALDIGLKCYIERVLYVFSCNSSVDAEFTESLKLATKSTADQPPLKLQLLWISKIISHPDT
jgi:hypothetical protein